MNRRLPKFNLRTDTEGNDIDYVAVLMNPEDFPHIDLETKFWWGNSDTTQEEVGDKFVEFCTTWKKSFINKQEWKDLFESIDVTKINEVLMTHLGLEDCNPDLKKITKYFKREDDNNYYLESEVNLVDSFPILAGAWSEFSIDTFSTWNLINEETGEISVVLELIYAYKHKRGGSNGAEVARIIIKKDSIEIIFVGKTYTITL